MQSAKKIAYIVIALLSSSGCDYIHFPYTDCRYYESPRFDRSVLRNPVLNQVYAAQLQIWLDEDRHIYNNDYWLEFDGRLPQGIAFYQENRNLYFEGAATSLGTYNFTITVVARYAIRDRYLYHSHRDYCSFRTVQSYQLRVEPF